MHIAQNGVDMAYRCEVQDMRIASMAAMRLRFCFCAQERAASPGAPMARRAGGGKSAGWPAWMPASFPPVHGCAVGKPRNPPAHLEGRMPGGRAIGVSFPLGYFSFGQAKEK